MKLEANSLAFQAQTQFSANPVKVKIYKDTPVTKNVKTTRQFLDSGINLYREIREIPVEQEEILHQHQETLCEMGRRLAPLSVTNFFSAAKTLVRLPGKVKESLKKEQTTLDKVFAAFKRVFFDDIPSVIMSLALGVFGLEKGGLIPKGTYLGYLSEGLNLSLCISSTKTIVKNLPKIVNNSFKDLHERKLALLDVGKSVLTQVGLIIRLAEKVFLKLHHVVFVSSIILYEIKLSLILIKNLYDSQSNYSSSFNIDYLNARQFDLVKC